MRRSDRQYARDTTAKRKRLQSAAQWSGTGRQAERLVGCVVHPVRAVHDAVFWHRLATNESIGRLRRVLTAACQQICFEAPRGHHTSEHSTNGRRISTHSRLRPWECCLRCTTQRLEYIRNNSVRMEGSLCLMQPQISYSDSVSSPFAVTSGGVPQRKEVVHLLDALRWRFSWAIFEVPIEKLLMRASYKRDAFAILTAKATGHRI